jgi:hypothetical protein
MTWVTLARLTPCQRAMSAWERMALAASNARQTRAFLT